MTTTLRLPTLRPRDRRALSLGAWTLGLLVILQFGVRPYVDAMLVRRAALASERSLFARESAAVVSLPLDRAELHALRARLHAVAPQLFDGADPVTASAELGRYAAQIAAESDLRVEQVETLTALDSVGEVRARGSDGAHRPRALGLLRVALHARGNVLAIDRFLRATEEGPKLVQIERLEIARPAEAEAFYGTLTFAATLTSRARAEVVPRADSLTISAELPNADASTLEDDSGGEVSTQAALSRDPFRTGGRLPDARAAVPPPETTLPVSVAAIRLLGTVIRPAGSFALCQLPADVPRIVHVGEKLGDLTLVSLEQGLAVFRAPRGARLELSLSKTRS